MRQFYYITLSVALAFSLAVGAQAYVSSSSNYRIEADSLNFGGGLSDSSNYSAEDTLGEVGTGISNSTNYNISAGYQAMIGSSISISSPSDVTLTAIDTATGGVSTGSASWTVTTDSSGGYTLSIQSSTDPALKSGSNSFLDYNPVGVNPDYNFSIGTTESAFGYTPEGSDIVARFKDSGSACGSGSDTSDRCWDGLSTSDVNIAQGSGSNSPTGTATVVKFRAEIGSSKTQATGSYSSTVTVTAVAL